jgi:hypothetical protein
MHLSKQTLYSEEWIQCHWLCEGAMPYREITPMTLSSSGPDRPLGATAFDCRRDSNSMSVICAFDSQHESQDT